MTTEEIEREDAGTNKKYRIVYRHKTYKDGEKKIQACILLPSGHPLFEVPEDSPGLQNHFPLPLIDAGQGVLYGTKVRDSWWLIFGDRARSRTNAKELEKLSLEDLKTIAVPQIIAALEEGETNPSRFSRRKKSLEADA